MAWTTDDLATIEAALATGAKSVKFSDREMEFPSVDDLRKVRSDIISSLAANGGTPQKRMVQMYTKSGF
jgi:hypothetical protein